MNQRAKDRDFKPGDRVVCVDATRSDVLRRGQAYTVAHVVEGEYLKLEELPGRSLFFGFRFRVLEPQREKDLGFKPGDHVVCVDATGSSLTHGRLYTVAYVVDGKYVKLKELPIHAQFFVRRFRALEVHRAAVEAFADGAAYARKELRERADKMIKDRPYVELANVFDELFGEHP